MTLQRSLIFSLILLPWLAAPVLAGDPDYRGGAWERIDDHPMDDGMPYPPRGPRYLPPPPPAPKFSDFPTPQELARMTPPEPITEEMIKERFELRKKRLKKMLDMDRQAAVNYAQDFSEYQKQQADALVKLMARAEKRRTAILQRLEAQEQRTLEYFRRQQGASDPTSEDANTEPESAPAPTSSSQ